jgi:hypothetical protein
MFVLKRRVAKCESYQAKTYISRKHVWGLFTGPRAYVDPTLAFFQNHKEFAKAQAFDGKVLAHWGAVTC